MDGAVKCDEVYVTAGLKDRNNSTRLRIRCLERIRRRGLRRWSRGTLNNDKPPMFILVERDGCQDYFSSTDVEGEAVQKAVGRRVFEGSKVYTDSFKFYN